MRLLLGRPEATLGPWGATALTAGWGTSERGGVVARVAGTATDHGETLRWSLILKALPLPDDESSRDPAHFAYRRREALLYSSGQHPQAGTRDPPGGLALPRCYGVDAAGGVLRLWLEGVPDEAGERWPLARFALAARHVGAFNGAYLAARPIPDAPWLARDWLPRVVAFHEPLFAQLATADLAPEVRAEWPDDLRRKALDLWARRGHLLALLAGQPVVFCHRDTFRRNLLARRRADVGDETVAIDWAFAGPGALGEDLAALSIEALRSEDELWEPVSPAGGPETTVESEELAAAIRGAVAALPPAQRLAVVLFYFSDMSLAEIAAALGIGVGTAKTRLHKARTGLRRRLSELAAEVDGRTTYACRLVADWLVTPAPRQAPVALRVGPSPVVARHLDPRLRPPYRRARGDGGGGRCASR